MLARRQDGILSRRQLYAAGLCRGEVRAEVRAGRWRPVGGQCVQVQPSLNGHARFWRAVLEVGPRAVLDGASALIASGLSGITEDHVQMAVPKSADPGAART